MGSIYETTLSPGAWTGALDHMRLLFNCHFADAFQRTHDFSAWRGIQAGLDESDYQDVFLGYWVKNNVWGKRRPTRRAGDIVTTGEMIGRRALQRTDMYSEYLRPRELQEGLRLDVWADEHGVEDISLLRPWSAGAFTAEELRAASTLMPHLRRASAIRRRLLQASSLAEAGMMSLEQAQMGVILLGPRGRLIHANRAAEALLRAGDPVGPSVAGPAAGPAAGLAAITAAGTRALHRLIHDAAGGSRAMPRSGSIRLPRRSGQPAMLVVAMPLRPGAADLFDPLRPAAFLCLIDRDLHRAPTQAHLTALFGLTPSEAGIASHLMSGGSLQDIADRTGRSVHTVRSLLSRVMAKTETNRQVDLVRLLTMLPPH